VGVKYIVLETLNSVSARAPGLRIIFRQMPNIIPERHPRLQYRNEWQCVRSAADSGSADCGALGGIMMAGDMRPPQQMLRVTNLLPDPYFQHSAKLPQARQVVEGKGRALALMTGIIRVMV